MNVALFIGKFSPIHKDHIKSVLAIPSQINKLHDVLIDEVRVFSTISTEKDKQPLPFEKKIDYAARILEPYSDYVKIVVNREPVKEIWNVFEGEIWGRFKDEDPNKGLYIIAGSDRVEAYEKIVRDITLNKYIKRGRKITFPIKVVNSAGRVDGIGISATEVRRAAKSGDLDQFLSYYDDEHKDIAKEMFEDYSAALKERIKSFTEIFALREKANWKDEGKEIITKIKTAFPSSEVLYIGGTARDFIFDRPCNDIDIACNIRDTDILALFNDDPNSSKEEPPRSFRFGDGHIVIVVYKGQKFDIDCIRGDIFEKIKKGDLTFNCMAYDPLLEKIYDTEGGIKDWRNQNLRFSQFVFDEIKVGREARSVFRPFKFQARYGWDFDSDTEDAIKEYVENCKNNPGKFSFNRVARPTLQKTWDEIVDKSSRGYSSANIKKAINNIKRLGLYDLLMGYQERKNAENDALPDDKKKETTMNFSYDELKESVWPIKEKKIVDASKSYNGAMQILRKIKEVGNKGYLVGGCVRDLLMGMTIEDVDDFDIITDMSAGFIKSKFGGELSGSVWRNGSEVFFMVVNDEPYDIKRIGRNSSFKDELEMRDLTINAIAWDPIEDTYFDPTGGKKDIQRKVLAFTKKNAALVANGQQPARVLRCIRFYATTGFDLSAETVDALEKFAIKTGGNFALQSEEYFKKNWDKMMAGPKGKEALQLLKDLELFDHCKNTFPNIVGDA